MIWKLRILVLVCTMLIVDIGLCAHDKETKPRSFLIMAVQRSHSTQVLAETMQPLVDYLQQELAIDIKWETAAHHKRLLERIRHKRYDILFADAPTTLFGYYQAGYTPVARIPGVISASFVGFVDGPAFVLEELKGLRLGFLKPSMVATQLSKRHLRNRNIKSDEYFGEVIYLANHNSALNALHAGRVDAIVIATSVFDSYEGEFNGRDLFILEQTASVPQYAFSVRKKMPKKLQKKIKKALLNAHKNEKASNFFKRRIVEHIIPADISNYRPYRGLQKYITR